ncbi:MAG: tRNA pseudouridine(38-40) synthase TruA [Mariprofundaceae bacterium]|nr:tRNA pseudouridine(38-40) synthase TruA [Mariprofundaceae bacterium]
MNAIAPPLPEYPSPKDSTVSQRIALCIEYDGHRFHGWQRQDNASSVQEHLEVSLARIEGKPVVCVAAGRTDAGVHAEAMLVHANVQQQRFERAPRAYIHGVNAHLPTGIVVLSVDAVAADFHARFHCTERQYRYQIWNRKTCSALHPWRHWWMPRPLNISAMQQAATYFVGKHDFNAVRASGCQAHSSVRTLHRLDVNEHGYGIHLHVRADAFLYHMVRNIAGCLVEVGLGRWDAEHITHILQQKTRQHAAVTAPAHGLYFTNACYPNFTSRELIEP